MNAIRAKPRPIDLVVAAGFLAVLFSAGLIQVVLDTRHGQWPQAWDLFRQMPTPTGLRAYEQNLEQASWLIKTLRPWMQYAQFLLLHDAGEKVLVGRDGWLFYRPGLAGLTGQSTGQPAPQIHQDPLPAILDFHTQLRARGMRLIVVPAPNKESVYPDKVSSRAQQSRGVLCPQTRRLLDALKDAGVEVVDLFAAFSQARQAAPPEAPALYLAQDTHWSPEGVALAAHAVAQRLSDHDKAGQGKVNYTTRPAPIRRVGDLVRMLQAPPLEDRAVPEEIQVVQVVQRDDGQLYRTDPNSDVLVLGDSFLRIYEQDEPGAAGFSAHLARELAQPVTSLVNDGGGATLVRQDLLRRPALLKNKRVVIWEFVERDIQLAAEGWLRVPLPPP